MPDDVPVLPAAGRARRAGDAVPTLREAVQAWVDGEAVAWEAVEQRGGTSLERRMTRQLRDLATLAGPGGADEGGPSRGLPRAVVVVIACVAAVQSLTGLTAALVLTGVGDGGAWPLFLQGALVLLAALALPHRGPGVPGAADLLLLLAAWAARGPIEAVAVTSVPWAVITTPLRVLRVEATVPVLLIGVALARVTRPRFTWRDRVGNGLVLLAGATMLVLVPAATARRFPTALPMAAAAWALVALLVLGRWGTPRFGARPGHLVVPRGGVAWIRVVLSDAFAAWRATHTTRLTALTSSVHRARTPREIASELARHLVEATGASQAMVLVPGDQIWTPLGSEGMALPATSALVALLEGTDAAVRVDPDSRTFGWLPAADRAWVREAGVAVVARLAAPDGRTVGGVVVGAREDGRAGSRRALAFISAAAGTAGVALATMTASPAHGPGALASEELPFECERCGVLSPEAARCACGGATALSALPAMVNGVFALERRIGRGGMGVVYRAWDTRLDRLVALKTLPSVAPMAAHALQGEARAMAALEHPSVASLYGIETWRGTPVLVVEYLAGGTLATRIASGPMRPGDAVALARVLAEALATLHARGWLHGDIKPSNIGLTRDGVPKLLDFGLTRWQAVATALPAVAAARSSDGTRPGLLAGTPLYLSPEALEGEPAGESDDVWALALVIVEMITGVHPFRGDTPADVSRQARAGATIDVRRWAPSTPAWLAKALVAALHPDRKQRLWRARALADALTGHVDVGHLAALGQREAGA